MEGHVRAPSAELHSAAPLAYLCVSSYAAAWVARAGTKAGVTARAGSEAAPAVHRPICVGNFYSDHLYQPWACASMGIHPSWLHEDNVDRVAVPTVAEFVARYEQPNKPGTRTCSARSRVCPAPALTPRSHVVRAT